jgi:hypothetical protein
MEHWETADAERVMAELTGAQVLYAHVEGASGLHLQLVDGRVFVIVGYPTLGIAILQPEGSLH